MDEMTVASTLWSAEKLSGFMPLVGVLVGGLIAWCSARTSAQLSARALTQISRDAAIRDHEVRRREVGEKLHITLERLLSDLGRYRSMIEAHRNGLLDDEKLSAFLNGPSADDEFGWTLIPLYVGAYFPTAVSHLDRFEEARGALWLSMKRLEAGLSPDIATKELFERTKRFQAIEGAARDIQKEVIVQLREAVIKLQS